MKQLCTTCRSPLVEGASEHSTTVGGERFVNMVAASVCAACGEAIISQQVLLQAQYAVALELARSGRRTGTALRFLRKTLGVTSKDLALLLGIAPETLSRWETGAMEVDAHAFAIVAMLVAAEERGDGTAKEMLKALHAPVPLATTPVRIAS